MAGAIPFGYAQELPQNLSISVGTKMLAGRPCWDTGTEKKSLVKHINIYMEKSLKQREQLEGYLRDKLLWWYENSKYDYPKEKKKDE